MRDTKAVAREIFERIWNEQRFDLIPELVAPGFVDHEATLPFAVRGVEGFAKRVEVFRSAFPDLFFTVEDQIAEGTTVATRWTVRGTHRGEILGIAPTGRRITVTGISYSRIEDGKTQESWTSWDTLGLVQQLESR